MRWKNAPEGEEGNDNREPGITTLNNAFKARIYIKRVGKNFEQFRWNLSNGYVSRSREIPFDVIEVDHQIAHYKLVISFKKKSEEIDRT